jgi:NitT/TauT family transport system substrate-binding protein
MKLSSIDIGDVTMKQKFLILLLVFSIGLAACSSPQQNPTPAEPVKVTLPMGYIPSVQFAPFYVAAEKGYFADAGIQVEFDYKFETDGVALVGANKLPFALVSGEQVPLARAQGLPVVYVMSWWHDFPVAVTTMSDSGIESPADLKGKKIGIPGLFGASYVGLRALLDAVGLKESDVTLDSIGFNQVEALVSGRDDAVVVYANNEPIQLDALGYDVRTFPVKDYVSLASNGIITNEKTIEENPELVRNFVHAVTRGLEFTLAEPGEAFTISRNYIEGLQESQWKTQLEVLNTSIEYWKAKQLGVSDPVAWDNMQTVLLNMGLLKAPVDLQKAYTNEFVK